MKKIHNLENIMKNTKNLEKAMQKHCGTIEKAQMIKSFMQTLFCIQLKIVLMNSYQTT